LLIGVLAGPAINAFAAAPRQLYIQAIAMVVVVLYTVVVTAIVLFVLDTPERLTSLPVAGVAGRSGPRHFPPSRCQVKRRP